MRAAPSRDPVVHSGAEDGARQPRSERTIFEIDGVREGNGKPVKVRVDAASLPDAVRKAADNGVTVDPATATMIRVSGPSASKRAEADRPTIAQSRPRPAVVAMIACSAAVAGALLVGIPLLLLGRPVASPGHQEPVATTDTVGQAPTSTGGRATGDGARRDQLAQAEQERRVQRQRDATARYWSALSTRLRKLHSLPSGKAAEGRALLALASDLGAMSSLDVDQKALQLGAQWTRTLRRIGEIETYMAGEQWLLDCMRHGANGDPLWAIEEKKRLDAEVGDLFGAAQDASTSVRQTLTQAYGVEFGHIP